MSLVLAGLLKSFVRPSRADIAPSHSALSQRLFGEDITPHKPAPKARDVARAAAEEASATSGAETPLTTEGEAEEKVEESKVEEKTAEQTEVTPAVANAE